MQLDLSKIVQTIW